MRHDDNRMKQTVNVAGRLRHADTYTHSDSEFVDDARNPRAATLFAYRALKDCDGSDSSVEFTPIGIPHKKHTPVDSLR